MKLVHNNDGNSMGQSSFTAHYNPYEHLHGVLSGKSTPKIVTENDDWDKINSELILP